MNIKTVTIVGANGTMGRNIAAIFASFGDATVYMVSRTIDKSKLAIQKSCASVKADSIVRKMIPADYSMLKDCVEKSDLIFECVAENLAVKNEITKKIASYRRNHTICCTGTSGLSITALSMNFDEESRKNYLGVHLFNPPYNMTLCEVISTEFTDVSLLTQMEQYLKNVLHRTVVRVKDSPAFLGNRIGFQFINEALQYAEKYKDNGGIDYIDAILGCFTGRSMPPLVTSNFVGLDVHQAIVDNLRQNTNDYANPTFVFPSFAQKLIAENRLGVKSGEGLYKTILHEDCRKQRQVYDIKTDTYRDIITFAFPFKIMMISQLRVGDYEQAFESLLTNHSLEAKLCVEFLLKYILYALKATASVGYCVSAADDVMATGFNWCPPLAMIQAFGGVERVRFLIEERVETENINVEHLLKTVMDSQYDYRKYFRASK